MFIFTVEATRFFYTVFKYYISRSLKIGIFIELIVKTKVNMSSQLIVVLSVMAASCLAQRSPYAGRLPIGYPLIVPSTAAPQAQGNDLGNRFGDDNAPAVSTTTQRLPIEALGDRELVNRISKLPIDQQPFWYINWQALEQQRKRPQTFNLRPNGFIDESSNMFFRQI